MDASTVSGKDLTVVIAPKSSGSRSLLPEVIDQLESLVRFLRSLTNDETTFEVVSLSTNSPLTARLRPLRRTVAPSKRGQKLDRKSYRYKQIKAPTERAAKTLHALTENRKLPKYADQYALMQLRELADDLTKTGHVATLIADDETFTIDANLRAQIDTSLGNARISYSSFTGRLERLNVHGSRWSFTIFPVAGPSRIFCYFDKDLLDEVKSLVTNVVTVSGRAVYRDSSPWPSQMRVDKVVRRVPAAKGLWNGLSEEFHTQWEKASSEEKELIDLEADFA